MFQMQAFKLVSMVSTPLLVEGSRSAATRSCGELPGSRRSSFQSQADNTSLGWVAYAILRRTHALLEATVGHTPVVAGLTE